MEFDLDQTRQTLKDPLRELSRWSEQHMKEVEAAQRAFDAKSAAA
jgi:DNA-binding HxlR family transcriptional regulator